VTVGDQVQWYFYSATDTSKLVYNSVKSTIYMDYLGRWLGEEHQWVTLQNRSLIGSQLRHSNVTLYGYTLNFSHVVTTFSNDTFNT